MVASLVAQYLIESGRTPVCFDADPLNESLVRIKALAAIDIPLLVDEGLNTGAVDELVDRILTLESDIVVDNGAASFIPMSSYLIENDIAALIEGAGKRMVIHSVITGGGNAMDTSKGLEAVLVNYPHSVEVVVWLNEFFGPIEEGGIKFKESALYEQHKDRIIGIVDLRRQSRQFADNIEQMLTRKLTFAEALTDPAFMTVPRQRLTVFRRSIWNQLATVL